MTVIPQNVLNDYLVNYTPAERAELQNTYETIRNAITTQPVKTISTDAPTLYMTAGAEGVGKSTYLKKFVADKNAAGANIVLIDWDGILSQIPSYANEKAQIAEYFNGTAVGMAQDNVASQRWIKGAKWIGDMLLNDLSSIGADIAFETTAHSRYIDRFMNNFHDAGYTIDLHFGDAPMDVKIESVNKHYVKDHGAYIAPESVIQKSLEVAGNMAKLAQGADKLTILWRAAVNGELKPIASSNGPTVEVCTVCEKSIKDFNAEHAKNGITLDDMMRKHLYESAMRARSTARLVAS